MVSPQHLNRLPEIGLLQQNMQAMAALEAVFAVDFGEPVYDFLPKWTANEQVATVKNGSGDELFVHFTSAGCFIKGFAHESVMSPARADRDALWPGLLDSVPKEFRSSLTEPAFDVDHTTFAIWRLTADNSWHTDDIELPENEYGDGSEDLLSRLHFDPMFFSEWLEENYEVEIEESIVLHVFQQQPLSNKQLRSLNPHVPLRVVQRAVLETGFPVL